MSALPELKFKTVIIIPTWNKSDLLKNLLEDLEKQKDKDFAVLVVDNGSSDGSGSYLKKKIEKNKLNLWALLLGENLGFAVANNIALNFALHFFELDFFLLLNNDTRVNPDFIKNLHERSSFYLTGCKLKRDSFPFLVNTRDWKIGSFAPLIENYFNKNSVDAAGIKIFDDGSSINRGAGRDIRKFKKEEEVFGPTGASALYLKKALKDVAGPPHFIGFYYPYKDNIPSEKNRIFRVETVAKKEEKKYCKKTDKNKFVIIPLIEFFASRYFAYFEDVDLAIRLRLRMWGCVLLPKAKVLHYHSATSGSFSAFKSFHIHRNQYFNLIRDYPSYHLISGLFAAFRRYFFLLQSVKKKKGPAYMLSEKTSKAGVVKIVIKGWFEVFSQLIDLLQERNFIHSNRLVSNQEFHQLLKEKRFRASLKKMIFSTPNFKQKKAEKKAKNSVLKQGEKEEQKTNGEEGKDQLPEWF